MSYKKTKFISTFLCAMLTVGSASVFANTAAPDHLNNELKVYTPGTAHEQPIDTFVVTNLEVNNNMVKEAPLSNGNNSNEPITVNITSLPAKTYRHVGTFTLKEGDFIIPSGFNVPKYDSRIVFAINDSRFTKNNGLYDFATSIYGQLNTQFVAEKGGKYELWIGNAADKPYTNLTGIIKAEQNDLTISDLVLRERPPLQTYPSEAQLAPYKKQLKELEERKDKLSEKEYGELKYLESMVNPNKVVATPAISPYVEAYTDSTGKLRPAEILYKVIYERNFEPMLSEYEGFLEKGKYGWTSKYFTLTVKNTAKEQNVLPKDGVTMEEINRRTIFIFDRFMHCAHLLNETGEYVLKEKKAEAKALIIKLFQEEFEITDMSGIEIDMDFTIQSISEFPFASPVNMDIDEMLPVEGNRNAS